MGGVSPWTAQAAPRHSTIDLTINVNTDRRLLDLAGAMETPPVRPLGIGSILEVAATRATGTDDLAPKSPHQNPHQLRPNRARGRQSVASGHAGKQGRPWLAGPGNATRPLFPGIFRAEGTRLEPPRNPRRTRGLGAQAVQIAVHSPKSPRNLAMLRRRRPIPTSPRL